jgi:hypothetical protein
MQHDIEQASHLGQTRDRLWIEHAVANQADLVREAHAHQHVVVRQHQQAPRTIDSAGNDRYADFVLIGLENRRQRWQRIAAPAVPSRGDLRSWRAFLGILRIAILGNRRETDGQRCRNLDRSKTLIRNFQGSLSFSSSSQLLLTTFNFLVSVDSQELPSNVSKASRHPEWSRYPCGTLIT